MDTTKTQLNQGLSRIIIIYYLKRVNGNYLLVDLPPETVVIVGHTTSTRLDLFSVSDDTS